MYYIEPKESDSIESQNACFAEDVIDYAISITGEDVRRLDAAIKILNDNGYNVFEDCY